MHGYGLLKINPGLKNQIIFWGYWKEDKLENGDRADHNSIYKGDFVDLKRSGRGK